MPLKMRSSHSAVSAGSRVEPHALAPSLPAVPTIHSDLAERLARDGYIVCDGVISGASAPWGQRTATINMSVPDFTRASQTAGGQDCVITVDCEVARYLTLFTEVELAIRVKQPRSE